VDKPEVVKHDLMLDERKNEIFLISGEIYRNRRMICSDI